MNDAPYTKDTVRNVHVKELNVKTTPLQKGLTLIEAGAGTGKTYSLVRLAARLIVEESTPVKNILIVTFTRSATAELSDRLQSLLRQIYNQLSSPQQDQEEIDIVTTWRRLGEEFLTQARHLILTALNQFDQAAILTIDGFFQRILNEYSFESDSLFTNDIETDENKLIEECVTDYYRTHIYSLSAEEYKDFSQCIKKEDILKFIKECKNNPLADLPEIYQKTDLNTDQWVTFTQLISENLENIKDFIQAPYKGMAKNAKTIFQTTRLPLALEELDYLSRKATPPHNLKPIKQLSWTYLNSDHCWTPTSKESQRKALSDHPLRPIFEECDRILEKFPEQYAVCQKLGAIHRFVSESLALTHETNKNLTYSDVANKIHHCLHHGGKSSDELKHAMQKNYSGVFIDEFQDTSPTQCQIFLSLFHNNHTYLHIIGDPKQSIYKFRGADVHAYIDVAKKAEYRYSLLKNFRSKPELIQATNSLFKVGDDPFFSSHKINFNPAQWPSGRDLVKDKHAPFIIKTTNEPKLIANDLTHHIYGLIGQPWEDYTDNPDYRGEIQPSDIAILVSSSFQAQDVKQRLDKLGVPTTVHTNSSLFDTHEAQDIQLILYAIINYRSPRALRAAALTTAFGSGGMYTTEGDAYTLMDSTISQKIHLCFQTWKSKGIMPAINSLCEHIPIRENLLASSGSERSITNFFHIIELLDQTGSKLKYSPEEVYQWLNDSINGQTTEIESEEKELRISTDDSALQILTIHKSKGLQYPIVFTPYIDRKFTKKKQSLIYHNPETQRPTVVAWNQESEASLSAIQQEHHADNARLLYVALTRACEHCVLYLENNYDTTLHKILGLTNEGDLSGIFSLEHDYIDIHSIDELEYHTLTPTTSSSVSPTPESQPENNTLTCKYLPRTAINKNRRTTSFTGLTRNLEYTPRDYDQTALTHSDTQKEFEQKETSIKQENFWSQLTAGTSLGLVFHDVLEEMDYTNPTEIELLIQNKLNIYQPWSNTPSEFHISQLCYQIGNHLIQWFDQPLHGSIKLKDIAMDKRLNEAAFLLESDALSLVKLSESLRAYPLDNMSADYTESYVDLDYAMVQGFLDGFIDLIYEHDGKYYIVDWKTNQVGNGTPEDIIYSMESHHYILQYHIYAIALDRLLHQKLGTAYDPETHIGGAQYVFLRALNSTSTGVFNDPTLGKRIAHYNAQHPQPSSSKL